MTRKSTRDQLIASIDAAFAPAKLGPPPPKQMPSTLTAPVYNRNCTKAFEEDIINIRPDDHWDNEWSGRVENSFGRNGRTVGVSYNFARYCWQYV